MIQTMGTGVVDVSFAELCFHLLTSSCITGPSSVQGGFSSNLSCHILINPIHEQNLTFFASFIYDTPLSILLLIFGISVTTYIPSCPSYHPTRQV